MRGMIKIVFFSSVSMDENSSYRLFILIYLSVVWVSRRYRSSMKLNEVGHTDHVAHHVVKRHRRTSTFSNTEIISLISNEPAKSWHKYRARSRIMLRYSLIYPLHKLVAFRERINSSFLLLNLSRSYNGTRQAWIGMHS